MYAPSYNSRCRPQHQVRPLKRDLNSGGYPNKIVLLPRTPTPGHDKGCGEEVAASHAIMSCSCNGNFICHTTSSLLLQKKDKSLNKGVLQPDFCNILNN
eukprot:XP_008669253.1 uncharacterized protein LOC103646300 [Zea mays]